MDMMNQEKIKALTELIKQMQGLMASGEGDKQLEAGDVSDELEGELEDSDEGAEIEADSDPSMEEACAEEDEMDPMEKMKQDFMRGKVDRPKRPSLMIMAEPKKYGSSVKSDKSFPESLKKKGYK